jgi:hypothetical protein
MSKIACGRVAKAGRQPQVGNDVTNRRGPHGFLSSMDHRSY